MTPDVRLQFDYIEGSVYYHQEENFGEAFTRLTAVLSKYHGRLALPTFRFVYEDIQQQRAFELFRLEKFDEAAPLFTECLSFAMKPTDRGSALASLGICCAKLKKYGRSERLASTSMQDGCNEGMGRACPFLLGVYLCPDAAPPRVQAGVPDLRGASLRVSPSVATALRMAISNLRTSGRKGGIGALRQAGATLLRPLYSARLQGDVRFQVERVAVPVPGVLIFCRLESMLLPFLASAPNTVSRDFTSGVEVNCRKISITLIDSCAGGFECNGLFSSLMKS